MQASHGKSVNLRSKKLLNYGIFQSNKMYFKIRIQVPIHFYKNLTSH